MMTTTDDTDARTARSAPSERRLLKDVAYEELKRRIVEGDVPPGTFLSERQLAEMFDMSKSPVRTAIERLNAEGYLIVSPQQGIVVAELSVEEIIDHFEIRIALECYVTGRLAGELREEQIAALEANLADQRRSSAEDDLTTYRRLDNAFHMLLASSLNNQEITRVMQRQGEKLFRIVTRVIERRRERMQSSTREHAAILEAIRDGNAELAAERMKEHLAWGKTFLTRR